MGRFGLLWLLLAAAYLVVMWQPAEGAAQCLYLLQLPCPYMGIDLWLLPAGWAYTAMEQPWMLALAVAFPASCVTVAAALLIRKALTPLESALLTR